MRTTLTLEPDVAEKLRLRMSREKITLKRAVNEALRVGLTKTPAKPKVKFKVEPHAFNFHPGIDLNKLNQLSDDLEIAEFLRKYPR